jgi:hypothetical protein
MKDGANRFLATFGPAEYRSAADYQKAVGAPLFTSSIGTEDVFRIVDGQHFDQRELASDPDAERMYRAPKRALLDAYVATLDRLRLDGFVYPAIQMPPPDETMAQDGELSMGEGGPVAQAADARGVGVAIDEGRARGSTDGE